MLWPPCRNDISHQPHPRHYALFNNYITDQCLLYCNRKKTLKKKGDFVGDFCNICSTKQYVCGLDNCRIPAHLLRIKSVKGCQRQQRRLHRSVKIDKSCTLFWWKNQCKKRDQKASLTKPTYRFSQAISHLTPPPPFKKVQGNEVNVDSSFTV